MNGLPPGWTTAPLGEIASTQLGKMLSQKSKGGLRPIPYLRNKNVQWGRIDVSDILSMDFTEEELPRFLVQPGDLLVCEGGEVGRAAIWHGQTGRIAFQKALHRVRPLGGAAVSFLLYQLMWLAQTNALDPFATGSTIKHLPQEGLRALPFVVPPVSEQRRIVAAIEEQFSRLDAADAAVSLAGTRLRRLGAASDEGVLAVGAPLRAISEIAKVGSGATPKRDQPRYWMDGNIPWVTSGQVNELRVSEPSAFITEAALRETGVKLWPAGTLLLAMYGEGQTRGRCSELAIDATTNQACAAVQVTSDDVEPGYLKLCLNAMYAANRRLSSGGVQPNLSLRIVRAIEVPVPNKQDQRRLVAEADARLSTINVVRAGITSAQRRSAALRRAILERAFRGELVPQDPSDEPASVLLDRIRAERAAQPKIVRTRRRAGSATPS